MEYDCRPTRKTLQWAGWVTILDGSVNMFPILYALISNTGLPSVSDFES